MRASGVYDQHRGADPFEMLGFLLVALVPLAPRPTFSTPTLVVTTGLAIGIVSCALVARVAKGAMGTSKLQRALIASSVLSAGYYVARTMFAGDDQEYSYAASRLLLVALVITVVSLITDVDASTMMNGYVVGLMALAVLTFIIGVTRYPLMEPVAPSRPTGGVSFPWGKTAGVPRSFGEQGIVISLGLSYLLVYYRHHRRVFLLTLGMALLVLTLFAQSRNVYLAVVVTVVFWILFVARRRIRGMLAALVCCFVATFVVEFLLPLVSENSVVGAIVGEGVYAANVQSRFALASAASSVLWDDLSRSLVGISHTEWRILNPSVVEAGVHNHILATLLFFGVLAGVVMLWAFFVKPIATAVQLYARSPLYCGREILFVLCAAPGILISINFYEGFFSISLALFVGIAWAAIGRSDSISGFGAEHDDVYRNIGG